MFDCFCSIAAVPKVALTRFCLHPLWQKQCGWNKDRERSFQWRRHGIAQRERTAAKSVERDQINDWLPLYGGTVRYVQLRGSQSAQEGSYILSGLLAPLGTHNKLGDVENNFCRTSSKPIASYTHKMVNMLCFHRPFHNVILGINPLFIQPILQILMFIHNLLWPGD